MKHTNSILVCLCLVAMSSPMIVAAAEPDRPNVIFIMADDLGYGHLGVYGQEKIQTPHIDQLAAEGMRFTQAYAGSTVCAPFSVFSMWIPSHTSDRALGGVRSLGEEYPDRGLPSD